MHKKNEFQVALEEVRYKEESNNDRLSFVTMKCILAERTEQFLKLHIGEVRVSSVKVYTQRLVDVESVPRSFEYLH